MSDDADVSEPKHFMGKGWWSIHFPFQTVSGGKKVSKALKRPILIFSKLKVPFFGSKRLFIEKFSDNL